MFGIDPTPFDVRLVAFGIPIRVHPTFWLGSILFGSNLPTNQLIFVWVCCAFVSILIHELGHAITAESFGWPTEIVMYFGGGLAISQRTRNNTPWRSIAVSLMGPVAGFMLLGLVLVIDQATGFSRRDMVTSLRIDQGPDDARFYFMAALRFLAFMNLYWGLYNLIPVLPLDGGYVLESFCAAMRFRDPSGIALKIGAVASGAAAYYFFTKLNQPFAGMLMLVLCVQSVGALQSRR